MIGHIIWTLFNWPNGIVVGNLLASVIWMVIIDRRHARRHKEMMSHLRLSRKAQTGRKTPEDRTPPETMNA